MSNSNQQSRIEDPYGVIIGVGSNINAEENIEKMFQLMESEIDILKTSSWLKTEPVGIKEQNEYTNGAFLALTHMTQEELNLRLKHIEDQCGRDRNIPKFGPRTMDLDILVWEGYIVDKDVFTRDFLQASIKELIPDFNFSID